VAPLAEPVLGPVRELLDQRQDRVADDLCAGREPLPVDPPDLGHRGDRLGRRRRHNADASLGTGQRRLDIEVALHHRLVGEQGPHRGGAEHVAPELRVDHNGWHGVLLI